MTNIARPSIAWTVPALILVSTGCGVASVGIGAAASSSGGGGNAATVASELRVTDLADAGRPVSSPARVGFLLADQENDAADLEIVFATGDGPSELRPITLAEGSNPLEHVGTGPYHVLWNFAADVGGEAFTNDVTLRLTVLNGISPDDLVGVELGNDPPRILESTAPASEESDGNVDVHFTVADSAGDRVDIRVEFNDDSVNGFPEGAWKPARPAGTPSMSPTPDPAIADRATAPEAEGGVSAIFVWDTDHDLNGRETDVRIRFTPSDEFEVGASTKTDTFRIDNNGAPVALVESGLLALNPDERRGIPIPFTVVDPEGDPVDVVVQWRRVGEAFPALPTTVAGLKALLADPEQRREKQIATELPLAVEGRVGVLPPGFDPLVHVSLPELSSSAATLLARGAGGATLEIRRSVARPRRVAATWVDNPLRGPVDVLPLERGARALVLDGAGSGAWRVIEIALSSGELQRILATGAGEPNALAFEPGERTILVASDLAGAWQVHRVHLDVGSTTPLVSARDGSTELGPVRGLASLGGGLSLITVASSLIRIEHPPFPAEARFDGSPGAVTLLAGLHTPWGIVVDPRNSNCIYLAERDAPTPAGTGQVVLVRLDGHATAVVAAKRTSVAGTGLPRPEALALERSGARLLATTDADLADGTRELRGLDLGLAENAEVFELVNDLPDGSAGLATGPAGLRVVALRSEDDLAVGGGVAQVRTLVGEARTRGAPLPYDPASLVATVTEPFDPPPRPNMPWRIARSGTFRGDPGGAPNIFLWDSSEVAAGGRVDLLVVPLDTDVGSEDLSASKRIRNPFDTDAAPLELSVPQGGRQFVVAADLNGDGLRDLASASSSAFSPVVFFQNGPGRFPMSPDLVLGAVGVLTDAVADDLNADGRLDLVFANYFGGGMLVYFQSGPGQFPTTPDLVLSDPATVLTSTVLAADLNGDGRLDLASGDALDINGQRSALSIYYQDQNGQLATQPDLRLERVGFGGFGGFVQAVATADLNRDGSLDLCLAEGSSDHLNLYYQSSTGQFDDPPDVQLSGLGELGMIAVTVADVDTNGYHDLVTAYDIGMAVFLQDDSGQFPATPDFDLRGIGATDWASATVADLDADGLPDLVSDGALFFQRSSREFPERPDLQLAAGFDPASAAADLNGDGLLDLVTASSSLKIFFQAARTDFRASAFAVPAADGAPADLNGDGLLDLMSRTMNGPGVFFQSSPGQWPFAPALRLERIPLAAADLNGDGRLDIIGTGPSGPSVSFQKEPGQFPFVPDVDLEGGASRAVEVADLTTDGLLDLVSVNTGSDSLTVFFQVSPGMFSSTPDLTLGPIDDPQDVVIGDLNQDGLLDLASANAFQGGPTFKSSLTVFYQSSLGSFPSTPDREINSSSVVFPVSIDAGDLNGDGRLDLVSANRFSNNVTVFFQTASGFPANPSVVLQDTLSEPTSVTLADLNGDGQLDVVSGNMFSGVVAFLQTSPGRFSRQPDVALSPGTQGVRAVDLDGDGELDLLTEELKIFFGGH